MHGPDVLRRRGRRPGDQRRAVDRRGVVEQFVVQAEPDLTQRQIGTERLGCRDECAALAAEAGIEIFGACAPVRGDRNLDTGACRPAEPPPKRPFLRAGRQRAVNELCPFQLFVGPRQSAGAVEQLMIVEDIANAPAHGAAIERGVAVTCAAVARDGRACDQTLKRGVGLDAEHMLRQREIIFALKSAEIAAIALEQVEAVGEVGRAGQRRTARQIGRPVGQARGGADVAADIPTGPVKGLCAAVVLGKGGLVRSAAFIDPSAANPNTPLRNTPVPSHHDFSAIARQLQ
jgi:hypothetical protein